GDEDLALGRLALLVVVGCLGRTLIGDLGRLVAAGVAEDATAQAQRFRVRFQCEGAVQGQQRAVPVAEPERGVAEPGPPERQVRVAGQDVAVRFLGFGYPSLAREISGTGHGPLARRVREQLVRRGRPHGATNIARSLAPARMTNRTAWKDDVEKRRGKEA